MSNYLEIANSLPMWLACIPPVVLVFVEAYIFYQKARKTGKKMGITDAQFRAAAGASAAASIGPALVVLLGMVSLLVSMGAPVAWIRLNYIGALVYEIGCAETAASCAGTALGSADMTVGVFATALWVMTACCILYILMTVLLVPRIEKTKQKVSGGNAALLGLIAASGAMGIFANLTLDRVLPFSFTPALVAAVVGFVVNLGLTLYGKKHNLMWTKKWSLTIAMFLGLVCGYPFIVVG